MTQFKPGSRRVRDRVFPILTLVVALAWALSTWKISRHMGSINFARTLLAAMTPQTPGTQPAVRLPPNPLFPVGPAVALPRDKPETEVSRRSPPPFFYVEGVVYVWEKVMYGVAGLLGLVGILSLSRRLVRGLHLIAGGVILLSTVGTLVGMYLLSAPDKGGLQPLWIGTHILVALVQSAYGVAVLLAFARRA